MTNQYTGNQSDLESGIMEIGPASSRLAAGSDSEFTDQLDAPRDGLVRLREPLRSLFVIRKEAARRVARLTSRQSQIMNMVLAGQRSKNIAHDLGISQRTVENHRAEIMKKVDAKCLPELVLLVLAASWARDDGAA